MAKGRTYRGKFAGLAVGLVGSMISPGIVAPVQAASGCVAVGEELVIALFNQLDEALAAQHPDKVARLFRPEATLIVGSAGQPRQGYDSIRDYYLNILQREPRLVPQERSSHIGCNQAIDSGTAALVMRGHALKTTDTILVRYTLAYELTSQGWRIAHHHLSEVRPSGAPDRLVDMHLPLRSFETASRPHVDLAGPRVAGYAKWIAQPARATIVRRYRSKPEPGLFDDYKGAGWQNGQPVF